VFKSACEQVGPDTVARSNCSTGTGGRPWIDQ
jgi:hypothetical protein